VGVRSSWAWISLRGGIAALWLGLAGAAHAQSGTPTENDGPDGVTVVGAYAQVSWARGDYTTLDQYFQDMAGPTERFDDGGSHLMGLSHGLGLSIGASTTRKEWEQSLGMIREWRQKNPQSTAVDIVEAQILRLWAWTARGRRDSSRITEEGWKLFHERLNRAEEVLFRSRDRSSNNPLWYLEYLNVARASGWDRAEFRALYAAAIARFPDFDPFYFAMIRYLDPDWNGDIEQIDAYIAEVARQTEARQGKIMYARLYWYLADTRNHEFSLFEDSAANWADIKTGFEQLIAATPKSSWNLNNFAALACRASDADTYRKLRKQIGERIYAESWPDNYTMEICDQRLLKAI
jgi:hypothetical protein